MLITNNFDIPYSLEIEKRMLGALISLERPTELLVQQAMLQLDASCFYNSETKLLFSEINNLFVNNKEFDFVSLSSITNAGILFETLRSEFYTSNLIAHDVLELINYKTLRKQLSILSESIIIASQNRNPQEALNSISEQMQKMVHSSQLKNEEKIKSYEICIEEELNFSDENQGLISTEIPNMPSIPNGGLITIAGRSGHGKTFFAMYVMDKIINIFPEKQSLYFNLEMMQRTMLDRHAILLGAQGKSAKERIKNAAHLLVLKDVNLISVPMITIEEIESISRISSLKKPISVIVVDYLGLVGSKTKYESNYLQQNSIAKRLAALAIELNCVVIALIQVNREFRNRPSGQRCPIPSDSSESMGSVHSASWWLGIDQPYLDDEERQFLNLFQVQCRKNRGDSGLFKLEFDFKNGQFFQRLQPFIYNYSNKKEKQAMVD